MSSTLNVTSKVSGTIGLRSINLGSLTPFTATVANDEYKDAGTSVAISATETIWDASLASEGVTAFSVLYIVPVGADIILTLTVDTNSNNGGVKTMIFKVPDGKFFPLFSNYSKAADGTVDVIDKIQVTNTSGASVVKVYGFLAG